MTTLDSTICRRRFLQAGAALGAVGCVGFVTPEAFAEHLMGTPPLTEGPFYPDKLPLDTDNDLINVNGNITPAVGEITHLTGRVLDASGSPVKNVTVEIWQCDAHQVYLNTRDSESQGEPERRELSRLRPVHDRLEGRVSVPHDQAGRLSGPPRPAHPLQDQARRS